MTEQQYNRAKRELSEALIYGHITYTEYLQALEELYKKHD